MSSNHLNPERNTPSPRSQNEVEESAETALVETATNILSLKSETPTVETDNISVNINTLFDTLKEDQETKEDFALDSRRTTLSSFEVDVAKVKKESIAISSAFADFSSFIRTSVAEGETASSVHEISLKPEDKMNVLVDVTVSAAPPRFHSDQISISGFFVHPELGSLMSTQSSRSSVVTQSTIKTKSSEVSSEDQIDREYYYELYALCKQNYTYEKGRGNYLSKRVEIYNNKRKTYRLEESTSINDLRQNYIQSLEAFDNLENTIELEKINLENELCIRKKAHKYLIDEVTSLFKKLQKDEYELTKEFPESPYKDKIVERHLKRQKLHLNNLINMRLNSIKCKNRLTEKEEELNKINNLGPNLYLMDYEQLKIDNRNLQDKLEEKETELAKVRLKCQNIMQALAHRREKTAEVEEDIPKMSEFSEDLTEEYEMVRETLNGLQLKRDSYRQKINKLKAKSCLSTHPRLLTDMENTISEKLLLEGKVGKLKKEYDVINTKLAKIKKIISSKTQLERIRIEMGVSESPNLIKTMAET